MAVVLRQGSPKDHQVKGSLTKGFLNALPADGGGHVMSSFGHLGGLARERLFVRLTVKNLDSCGMSRFLSSCGQSTLLALTRSLTSSEHASEVTEDQGQMGDASGNWPVQRCWPRLLRQQLNRSLPRLRYIAR